MSFAAFAIEDARKRTSSRGIIASHFSEIGQILYYNANWVSFQVCQHKERLLQWEVCVRAWKWVIVAGHTFSSEEAARDIDGFAANDDNLLSGEQLLGHRTGQAAHEMPFAIYRNLSS